MCLVSSECNKFLIRTVPEPKAANTRALLEIDFEPGGMTTLDDDTTSALTFTDSKTVFTTSSLIEGKLMSLAVTTSMKVLAKFSNAVNSCSFQIAAVFTTSAMPLMNCAVGNDSKKDTSIKMYTGWWKAPMKFLPNGVSIAVFPPTEESTIANKAVGICTNRTPLMKVAATKPIMSPMTPPPTANITVSAVQPFCNKKSSTAALVARFLFSSPGETT